MGRKETRPGGCWSLKAWECDFLDKEEPGFEREARFMFTGVGGKTRWSFIARNWSFQSGVKKTKHNRDVN